MPNFWFQTRILLLKFKLGNESRNVKKVQIHDSCIHFYSRMYMILSECTKITLEFKLLQNITLFNWNGKFHMSNIFLNVSNLSSYRRGIWILLTINSHKLLLVFTLINTQKKTSKKQIKRGGSINLLWGSRFTFEVEGCVGIECKEVMALAAKHQTGLTTLFVHGEGYECCHWWLVCQWFTFLLFSCRICVPDNIVCFTV